MPVARLAAGHHSTVDNVERCKQRSDAMALVVVDYLLWA